METPRAGRCAPGYEQLAVTRRGCLCQREFSVGFPCNPSEANFGCPSQPCDGDNDGV
eukprot:COSAG01_NODE_56905_length_315_cov_1.606481_1_plen_56_part_01